MSPTVKTGRRLLLHQTIRLITVGHMLRRVSFERAMKDSNTLHWGAAMPMPSNGAALHAGIVKWYYEGKRPEEAYTE